MNYYNEFDPKAAAWLRELIKQGHIAPGVVDERSIEDVKPGDLDGYQQCHFFAGIGGWSLALRLAGWPDDQPVWTGSCPCQPFSAAGKGAGFADERHLWPAWFHLIRQRSPAVVFGEQVASAHRWLDLVHSDLEAVGYAVGAMPIEAASVGANHLRDRYWFVADAERACDRREVVGREAGRTQAERPAGGIGRPGGGSLADASGRRFSGPSSRQVEQQGRTEAVGSSDGPLADSAISANERSQPQPGFWTVPAVDGSGNAWITGHDGKARRVEPSIRLLADAVSARVVRLRGYGNAIVPTVAAEFIGAYLESRQQEMRIAA